VKFKFGTPDGKIVEALWDDGTLTINDGNLAGAIEGLIDEERFVAASPLGPFVEAGLKRQVQAYATLIEAAYLVRYQVLSQPDLGYGIEPESVGG